MGWTTSAVYSEAQLSRLGALARPCGAPA